MGDVGRPVSEVSYLTSVCTGSLILGAASLLEGKRAASLGLARHAFALRRHIVQLGLEYAPAPPFEAGHPEIALPDVLRRVLDRQAETLPPNRAIVEHVAAVYQYGPTLERARVSALS